MCGACGALAAHQHACMVASMPSRHSAPHRAPLFTTPSSACPQVKWAGDRCCVCDSDIDYDTDQLVSCDGCGITVHQSCYGIPECPAMEDLWLCRCGGQEG
jgi:hypothetical protein